MYVLHRTWSFLALAITVSGLLGYRLATAVAADPPPSKKSTLDIDDEEEPPIKPEAKTPKAGSPQPTPGDSSGSQEERPSSQKTSGDAAEELPVPVYDTILCKKAGARLRSAFT